MPSTHKALKFDEKMRNSERLKVSFLFQPFSGPSFSFPLSTWPFTTLPWHRHSNIENSQTFINQIFFAVLLSFFSLSTEGYIWFFILWRVFSDQSIVQKDSGVCACMHGHVKKSSENCCLKFLFIFRVFSFNQIESCQHPDISITYWFIYGA